MRHEVFLEQAAPSVSLPELVGAFSYALDLTEGQPAGHCVRACWIGSHVGRELGLSAIERSDLYYTILLKDLGCSSNAARICELYEADDRAFKQGYKTVGTSLAATLRFVRENRHQKVLVRDLLRSGEREPIRKHVEEARELQPTQHGFEVLGNHVGGQWGSPSFGG